MAEAAQEQDKVLNITVLGAPVPKERPRLGKGKVYTPSKTRNAEKMGALAAKLAMKKQKVTAFEGPVSVAVQFFRNRKVTAKPDLDNYVKLMKDYLEKAGVFAIGDEQVVAVFAGKFKSEREATVIMICEEER